MKALCTLFLSCWLGLAAAQPQSIFLIFDGSGSMWQKVENEYKIGIARQVLKDLVGRLPADTRLGLMAYGHRRKDDCSDIEVLAPLGPIDQATLFSRIDALNPTGKTPISASIEQTLALVRKDKQAVSIILISDGLETCSGDPCALVKAAKEEGLSFVFHVVGFGLEEDDVSSLECVAQAGGGLYFDAQNAADLESALDQAVETPVAEYHSFFSVKGTENGQLLDVAVKVVDPATGKDVAAGRTYASSETNPRLLPVPPGNYEVQVSAVRLKGSIFRTFADQKVSEGDTIVLEADFSPGALQVGVTRNGELSDATIQVFAPGQKAAVAAGRSYRSAENNPRSFDLTAGTYTVVVSSVEIAGKPEVRFEEVVVEPRKTVEKTVAFASGALSVGASSKGELVDAGVTIYELPSNRSVDAGRTYMSPNSNPKSFTLQPGKYRVVVKAFKPAGLGEQTFELELPAGQEVSKIVEF